MKKQFFWLVVPFFFGVIAANAQTEKPVPPPPPKKIIEEKVEFKKTDGKVVKEPPVITVKGQRADEFYKRNPSVAEISRQGNIITLKKKDGTLEKYDMNKKEEHKSFTEKYGVSPIPPPPPPKIIEEKVKVKEPPPPPPKPKD